MQLHELKSYNQKPRSRVGRGGKRGTTSGRGQKGQKSRSGRRIRPASRDLILKLPKRRGFMNKPTSPKPFIIQIRDLMRKLAPLTNSASPLPVNQIVLKQAGLLPVRYHGEVKILGKGKITKPIALSGIKASESVKVEIEKSGGSVALHNANSANQRANATNT